MGGELFSRSEIRFSTQPKKPQENYMTSKWKNTRDANGSTVHLIISFVKPKKWIQIHSYLFQIEMKTSQPNE